MPKKKYIVFITLGILYTFLLLKYNIGIPCVFHKVTGLYCPGCGGNRAVISLLKLDFYHAFRYNMIITILIPVLCIYYFLKYILKKDLKLPNSFWYILLVIIIIFVILRNIPIFYFLAPN